MLCVATPGAGSRFGSRRPKASGRIISTAQARMKSASCQPNAAISPPSIGTIRNWPNEPAAAVMPIAQLRFSGATLRPITP